MHGSGFFSHVTDQSTLLAAGKNSSGTKILLSEFAVHQTVPFYKNAVQYSIRVSAFRIHLSETRLIYNTKPVKKALCHLRQILPHWPLLFSIGISRDQIGASERRAISARRCFSIRAVEPLLDKIPAHGDHSHNQHQGSPGHSGSGYS